MKISLKEPVVVYALGFVFILAPFCNFLMSLILGKTPGWYLPSVWIEVIPMISSISWAWMGLLFLSGIGLLVPRKSTWIFSICSLLFTIIYNFYAYTETQNIFIASSSVFATFSLFLVIYFFRFPYLDRRESWWGTAFRHPVDFAMRIEGYQEDAYLKNISMTGLLFHFKNKSTAIPVGTHINFQIDNIPLRAEIIRSDGAELGAIFIEQNKNQKSLLKRFLFSLNTKIEKRSVWNALKKSI